MKYFLYFLLLTLNFACHSSSLTEDEKRFLGSWSLELNSSENGNRNFSYLELNESRKGINGIVVSNSGRYFLALSYDVFDWGLNGDTLMVDYMMKGGRVSGPGRKDTVINDFPVRDLWIIKERQENVFRAENFDPEIPFFSEVKFTRTDKMN